MQLNSTTNALIPFNKPAFTGPELDFINQSINNGHLSANGEFTKRCENWFETKLGCERALLTSSCTHALEISANVLDIKPGDEVIMSSYTFSSTANAFILFGAKIVFVDIHPDSMNINENCIEKAITPKTRVIVAMHYAGMACEMDIIMNIADKYNLFVVEDAAQCIDAKYKNKHLGTIGHFGAISFHETKNITSGGEGGLLIINDKKYIKKSEIFREKGTNRSAFFRGEIDKYSWVDKGSSHLLSELGAAYLWGNILSLSTITSYRLRVWQMYFNGLKKLMELGLLELPVAQKFKHNAHIFFIKVKNGAIRDELIHFLKKNNISAVFHYIPLHTSQAGLRFSRFVGSDQNTLIESERLIRLPMYFQIQDSDIEYIVDVIKMFFNNK
jgi:dTDP-4-amino-4,6-dideoxygalactose transaminase